MIARPIPTLVMVFELGRPHWLDGVPRGWLRDRCSAEATGMPRREHNDDLGPRLELRGSRHRKAIGRLTKNSRSLGKAGRGMSVRGIASVA